jgi:AcrR family transcriptional regulator
MSTLISKKRSPKVRSSRRNRQEKKDNTRQAILRAALALFAQKGFYETTTRAISRKAKIAEGTLFNYFETKEDLALYFFEQELAEVVDWYRRDKRTREAPLQEKLFAIIHHLLDRIAPYEDFIGAVYLRAMRLSSKLSPLNLQAQQNNLRYLTFIREVLAEAEECEEIPLLGDMGAFALFHLEIITYWLQDRSPGKAQTMALVDRWLKMGSHLLKHGDWEW